MYDMYCIYIVDVNNRLKLVKLWFSLVGGCMDIIKFFMKYERKY